MGRDGSFSDRLFLWSAAPSPSRRFMVRWNKDLVKQYGLAGDTKMATYFPAPRFGGYIVVRTGNSAESMASTVVSAVHAVDPYIPVYDVRTMPERVHDSLARERFATTMMTAFALFATILAAVGVYGSLSYMITQGLHDIGVRIALGASRSDILNLVIARGMELAGTGIALGILGAFVLTRAMSALLFRVSA